MENEITTGRQLLNEVMGRFRMKGTSLNAWCSKNGLKQPTAHAYLLGQRNSKRAKYWRRRIVEEARQRILESTGDLL